MKLEPFCKLSRRRRHLGGAGSVSELHFSSSGPLCRHGSTKKQLDGEGEALKVGQSESQQTVGHHLGTGMTDPEIQIVLVGGGQTGSDPSLLLRDSIWG